MSYSAHKKESYMEKRANNVKRTSRLLLSILLTGVLYLSSLAAGFPDRLTDTDGAIIDLKELVSKKRVIVITIKTPECPVCQHQLIRIKEKLNVLVACNVTFLVLSPGSVDKIEKAKSNTKFPFPFIMDNNLEISKSLDLTIDEFQILPSILILNEKLEIEWEQRGRNAIFFGDPELMKILKCSSWI